MKDNTNIILYNYALMSIATACYNSRLPYLRHESPGFSRKGEAITFTTVSSVELPQP